VSDRTAGGCTALQRTVKSRGPDASEVGVKSFGGAKSPNRADVPCSGRRRRHESPILRGEREVRRKAIAQGMSDCLRCPVCSCACFLPFAHETAGAVRIRHSPRPLISRRESFPASLGRSAPREREVLSIMFIARNTLVRRSPPSGEGGCDEAIGGQERAAGVGLLTSPRLRQGNRICVFGCYCIEVQDGF
jgi:hypothetical protein